jgi:hypothetical protein
MIGEAIYSILADDSDVSGVVATRIFPGVIPQNIDRSDSCLVYHFSGRQNETLNGTDETQSKHLTVDCWAPTYAEADTLSDYVIAALDNPKGEYASTTVESVTIDDESDDYEPPIDATDRGLHSKSVGFRVWYTEE